ncbi:MAG: HAD-IC family P-type ATPase [Chloroflexota bacterium]|nr:HAD-IC family P-type ATPase [Chloroflexota bacterium]
MTQKSDTAWHRLSSDEALAVLEARAEGLSHDEAETRQKRYGPNTIKSGKETSAWKILLHQIASPLVYVLLAAMVITVAIQHWADAIVIGIVVVLNTVIGFVQEYRAENTMQALIRMSAPKAMVRRDNHEEKIDSSHLVSGDIVLLEAGDIVPADLRLLDSVRLQVDESLLTGESVPSQKSTELLEDEDLPLADQDNMAFMGTAVTAGKATGVVVTTGHETQMGSIATDILTTTRAESPLQRRMKSFAKWISIIILAVTAIAFGVGLSLGEPLVDMFLTAVSLAVSAMPEGLPVVMTIALAVSVQRMAKRNAVLRRLPAVETLGSCTAILSDKTGTLTQNQMVVQKIWTGNARFQITDDDLSPENGSQPSEAVKVEKGSPLHQTLVAGVLANEASFEYKGNESITKGDPTEVALLVSGSKAGLTRDELLKEYPLLDQIPFDSKQRYSASIHTWNDTKIVFLKGAPERVVKMCDSMAGPDGPVKMDKERALGEAERIAEEGLRVLAMAKAEDEQAIESIEKGEPGGFTLLGLQGMMDPPREDAARAIASCHRAGILVMMVTGDNPTTAAAIAQKVGISEEKPQVLTGSEMEKMPDHKLEDALNKVRVFARINSSQKLRLVNILRKQGQIIAVTGDGVNDAPALKSAHIGAAMGKSGTDVAKEASEMVITDDNFATIYAAVEEGRTVFANIRKATFFLISSGIGEVLAILGSLAMRLPLPLLPAQILWLNVVTNGVEDVALAFEPGEKDQYRRPPRAPKAGILSRLLIERSLIVGVVMAVGTLGMFMWEGGGGATLEYARVAALTTMVMFQIFHVFNSRSVQRSVFRKNLLSNKFLFVGTILSFAIHFGAMYFGPTQTLLRLEPLSMDTWLRLIPIALSILAVVEIHKLFRHPSYRIRQRDPDE